MKHKVTFHAAPHPAIHASRYEAFIQGESIGIVRREQNPHHGRRSWIATTPGCRDIGTLNTRLAAGEWLRTMSRKRRAAR